MNVGLRAWSPRVLSVCSGIGGLDLGLKRAVPRARTLLYVEREAFACAVLAARMEDESLDAAPIWSDLGTIPTGLLRGRVDLVLGGIPCQPVSVAGKRRGTEDERWLWPIFWRTVRDVDARWIFVENVPGILVSGLHPILRDLAAAGWSAEWGTFSAAEVGAPQRRERLFLLANANGYERGPDDRDTAENGHAPSRHHPGWCRSELANPGRTCTRADQSESVARSSGAANASVGREALAHAASGSGQDGSASRGRPGRPAGPGADQRGVEHAPLSGLEGGREGLPAGADGAVANAKGLLGGSEQDSEWESLGRAAPAWASGAGWPPGPNDLQAWRQMPAEFKPAVCGVAARVPNRLDRLRALGNAVVPATAELAIRTLWSRLMEDQ